MEVEAVQLFHILAYYLYIFYIFLMYFSYFDVSSLYFFVIIGGFELFITLTALDD